MTIALLLDLAVGTTPDRPAVSGAGTTQTFAELDERANAAATLFVESGARSVAFLGRSGPAFHVALFAAARAGLPITPLNYRLAPDQVARLVDRLDSPMVLADEAYLRVLDGTARLTSTDTLLSLPPAVAPPAVDVDPAQPAVMLFTSGTTAEPKGVVLRHEHLTSYVLQTVDPGSADDADAALVCVPPYHVAGVGTVLTNTVAGRRVVHLPDFDPREWLRIVEHDRVTSAMVVPTMLARIVDTLADETAVAPALRSIAYGGARVNPAVLARALQAFPDTGFVNAYGLTETSSTIALLDPDDHREALGSDDPAVRARLASAGKLIPGIEAQVRGDDGTPLPAGEPGELWVRGPQVSGEYLGTGSVLDADGWFPTRDRARVDAHGYLFLDGRSDDTIIRGGENIAPAEIEDVLALHPGIADVAVIGVPDSEWGERLVAVVVARPDADPLDPAEIVAYARARLRGSRTPDDVVFRTELPVTPTGKLLRRDLVAELSSAAAT